MTCCLLACLTANDMRTDTSVVIYSTNFAIRACQRSAQPLTLWRSVTYILNKLLNFMEMTNMYPAYTQSRPLSCRCLDSDRQRLIFTKIFDMYTLRSSRNNFLHFGKYLPLDGMLLLQLLQSNLWLVNSFVSIPNANN